MDVVCDKDVLARIKKPTSLALALPRLRNVCPYAAALSWIRCTIQSFGSGRASHTRPHPRAHEEDSVCFLQPSNQRHRARHDIMSITTLGLYLPGARETTVVVLFCMVCRQQNYSNHPHPPSSLGIDNTTCRSLVMIVSVTGRYGNALGRGLHGLHTSRDGGAGGPTEYADTVISQS